MISIENLTKKGKHSDGIQIFTFAKKKKKKKKIYKEIKKMIS